MLLWTLLFMHLSMHCFKIYLQVQLLGHNQPVSWTWVDKVKLFSKLYTKSVLVRPQSLHCIVLSEILLFVVWWVCDDIPLYFLTSVFLITVEASAFFICLLPIWISSSGVLVQIFCLFFNWIAYFSSFICINLCMYIHTCRGS